MKEKELFGVCPFFTTQKILSGKWTILILHLLEGKAVRFNELENWGNDYIDFLEKSDRKDLVAQ